MGNIGYPVSSILVLRKGRNHDERITLFLWGSRGNLDQYQCSDNLFHGVREGGIL